MDEYRNRHRGHMGAESHSKPPEPEVGVTQSPLGGLFSMLPFGADFLESNWLIVLLVIVGAVLYFVLGRQDFGISGLLGGFLK